MAVTTASGARKAAVLLLQLGRDRAAEVLRTMDDEEIQLVTSEMQALHNVPEHESIGVLTEFVAAVSRGPLAAGGPRYVRELLTAGLGADRASAVLERVDAAAAGSHFTFLAGMEPAAVAALLVEEQPQAIAVVLATIGPERALRLLRALPTELQGDVAYRVATMASPSALVVAQVEAGLERRLAAASSGATGPAAGGSPLERLVSVLSNADAATEATVLARLDAVDPSLAAEVRKQLLTFDDLVRLDDKAIQLVLREVDTKTLALALKGSGEPIRAKITGNLSERASANLLEEVELLGPQRKTDIEAARQSVVATVRELEAAGTIVITRVDDDYVD